MINDKDKITVDTDFSMIVMKTIYYSDLTKRGLYKVYNEKMGTYYALKVFDLDINEIKDIEKEIISYNRIDNKLKFPKIHFSFQKDNSFYLLMDWIDGVSILDVFKNSPKDAYELKNRINYCIDMCNSLESIHNSNLIHRDLKPENILITDMKNAKNAISIIDFGLSATKRNLGGEGTARYQSPEQEFGLGSIGKWSDIYALGQVFYFMLHGHTLELLPNDDYNDWINFNIKEIPSVYDNELYKNLFSSLLAFKTRNRYQSIKQLLNDLKSFQRSIK